MRGSPLQNFFSVLALLTVMALGVHWITKSNTALPAQTKASTAVPTDSASSEKTTRVELRVIFSHPPQQASIERVGGQRQPLNFTPSPGEVDLSLDIPTKQLSEFLLDVQWPEDETARHFVQISLRQAGKEDDVLVIPDAAAQLSDLFSIDTRNSGLSLSQ